jgi:tol-pal system protein YbgF
MTAVVGMDAGRSGLHRPSAARVRAACAALALLAFGTGAQAGLFDDDEARRAILDLRTRLVQLEQSTKSHDAQTEQTLQQIQSALLDLNNQNEQLRQQLAQMRGTNEQLARDLADVQRHQKDLVQGVDDRLKRVEPQQVNLDGKQFTADPEEIAAYENATATLRSGQFDQAVQALAGFLRRYPASGYADSVRYWLGNAQFGNRDFKGAIQTFRAFVGAAPDHPRAPEALLAVANCQIELKDNRGARKTLDELMKTYPKSEAASAGRDRLSSLPR